LVCLVLLAPPVRSGQPGRLSPRFSQPVQAPQRPDQTRRAKAVQRQGRDRFVIPARGGIDDRMIVQARAGIDEGMIFNPYTRGRQPEVIESQPGNPVVPAPEPGPAPAPDGPLPPEWVPQPPVDPQPR